MLESYRKHVEERAAEGVPPKPLDAQQVAALVELMKSPPPGEGDFLLELLSQRVPPGVDEAAYVKAGFLAAIAKGETSSPLIEPVKAVELLGTMLGGYNVEPLIQLLDDARLGPTAAKALSHTLLIFDSLHDVLEKARAGNANSHQKSFLESRRIVTGPSFSSRTSMCAPKTPVSTGTPRARSKPARC